MDFDTFSLNEFRKRGFDSPEAEKLASQLEDAVLRELHVKLMPEVHRIVGELNQRGHRLKLHDEPVPGDIAYRHPDGQGEKGLRLGFDMVISSGYSHLLECSDRTADEMVDEVAAELRRMLRSDDPDLNDSDDR